MITRRYDESPWRDVLLAFLVSLGLGLLNPLGEIPAVQRFGRQLFNQLFAPPLYGEGSRDLTAVVLLQDADLAELDMAWPARYGEHARILGAIRQLKPRALAIDLLFIDRRPDETLDDLVQELGRYREAGMPVLLARPPVKAPRPDVLAELLGVGTAAPVPRFTAEAGENSYPLVFVQCDPKDAGDPGCTPGPRRTLAAELYRAFCNRPEGPEWFCRPPVLRLDAERMPEAVLDVFWGVAPDPISAATMRCRAEAEGFIRRLYRVTMSRGDAVLDCPFTPTVAVRRLLDLRTDAEEADLAKLIRDRVVFYGASLVGLPDIVRPPTHAPLPGVYAHAMAFDNLLTFGADYKRESIRLLGFRLTAQGFQKLIVFVLQVPLLFFYLRYQARYLNRRRLTEGREVAVRALFRTAYVLLAIPVVLFLTVVVEFAWLDLSPGNWIEAVFEAVAAKEMAPALTRWLGRFVGPRAMAVDSQG